LAAGAGFAAAGFAAAGFAAGFDLSCAIAGIEKKEASSSVPMLIPAPRLEVDFQF
jgi:hypothetical protein